MTDDGLRRRWLPLSILATAIIVAILLLVPSSVVSYQNTSLSSSTPAYVAVATSTVSEISITPEVPIYDPETERLLHAIAMCESGGMQFRPDGSVVKNPHSSATGKWQLMASIWRPVALKMGHDIDTEAGNKAMAYYILKEAQGIQAWKASASCLAKYNIYI